MDGWGSYTSAGGRRNERRTQGLDPVIAEHILSSMGQTGGPGLTFILRNPFLLSTNSAGEWGDQFTG